MRVRLEPIDFWFHDLCSCLQDCFAVSLRHAGRDPVLALGAAFDFHHDRRAVTAEEFYFPPARGSIGADLFPYHGVEAVWRSAPDAASAWRDIRAVVAQGRPPIVAEDNFLMPNRPAFGDVHAAHLVVIYGFDDEAGTVDILEPTPPLYRGPLPIDVFLAAIGSGNEARAGTRDHFFAGATIAHRWIDATIPPVLPQPTVDFVRGVLRANVASWGKGRRDASILSGIDGLSAYLRDVVGRARTPGAGREALSELYTVGWASQARAALHADFLAAIARLHGRPDFAEAGRLVERIATGWTALRLFGAHGGARGLDVADRIERRIDGFLADHRRALDRLDALGLEREASAVGSHLEHHSRGAPRAKASPGASPETDGGRAEDTETPSPAHYPPGVWIG